MKITRDDVIKRTKGELSRLFASAQAELSRQPVQSVEHRNALASLETIRTELASRPDGP